jgi:MFS family permease
VVDKVGRKTLIVVAYGIAGCAALSFTQATTEMTLLAAAMFYAFFQDIGNLAMTVYTPEVVPGANPRQRGGAGNGLGPFWRHDIAAGRGDPHQRQQHSVCLVHHGGGSVYRLGPNVTSSV